MAQLNSLIVNGESQFIGGISITSIIAPSTAGGVTYTNGISGQALISNGSSVYWGNVSNGDYVLKSGDTMTGALTISNGDSTTSISASGYIYGTKVYGAVWNDYAEYRKNNPNEIQEPGRCVRENGDGSLSLSTERLERGCEIITDTFGFAIGQDEVNGYNTPIASNGRVLAYLYEGAEEAKKYIGYPVCSGPNGTVSIMTPIEEAEYPSRIIGTISEVPNYEEWGTDKIKVNGRVWIRIR